jgi:hypothetical protein
MVPELGQWASALKEKIMDPQLLTRVTPLCQRV